MIRIRLLGCIALVRDDEIISKLEPLLEPRRPAGTGTAPWRHLKPSTTADHIDTVLPGILHAVMRETRALNEMGLAADELIIWDKNKVRANPGPHYADPRDPDQFSVFAA